MPGSPHARRRLGAVLLLWTILGMVPSSHAGAATVAFPDGRWVATSVTISGSARGQDATATGRGDVTFWLHSDAGRITKGEMTVFVFARATHVEGASGHVQSEGLLRLGGTSSNVQYVGGELTSTGSITVPGAGTIPLNHTGPPGEPGFSPSSATCTTVTGDLAVASRSRAAASGLSSSFTAVFLAVRQPDGSTATTLPKDLTGDYTNVLTALIQAVKEDIVEPERALQLAAEIERLHSRIVGLAPCSAAGGTFQQGVVASDVFVEQLYLLLDKVLLAQDLYATPDLLALYSLGVRTGVIGASAPDPARSAALNNDFVQVIFDRIAAAEAEGDIDALTAIAAAAAQAGAAFEPTLEEANNAIRRVLGS